MQIVPSSYLMYCNSYSVIDINIDIGRLTNTTNAPIIFFLLFPGSRLDYAMYHHKQQV